MNVMLLDDDAELVRLLEGVLEADGMWVVQYSDPADAVGAAVKGEWIAALVNLDLPDGAAEAFLEVLGDRDPLVQLAAAQALARLGQEQAIPPLQALRDRERDPERKALFSEALEALGGG